MLDQGEVCSLLSEPRFCLVQLNLYEFLWSIFAFVRPSEADIFAFVRRSEAIRSWYFHVCTAIRSHPKPSEADILIVRLILFVTFSSETAAVVLLELFVCHSFWNVLAATCWNKMFILFVLILMILLPLCKIQIELNHCFTAHQHKWLYGATNG